MELFTYGKVNRIISKVDFFKTVDINSFKDKNV